MKHLHDKFAGSTPSIDSSLTVKLGETLPNILLLLDYFGESEMKSKRRNFRSVTIS